MTLDFFVVTRVAGQGSKVVSRHGGVHEQSKYVAPFRTQVRASAVEAVAWSGWRVPQRGVAVRVDAVFLIARPKRPSYGYPPAPDADKCLRALNDALSGVVFADDSQVVAGSFEKRYAAGDEVPGVKVSITVLDDGQANR